MRTPAPPGNRFGLSAGRDRLFWLQFDAEVHPKASLVSMPIDRDPREAKPAVLVEGVDGYELSADRKRLLVLKDKAAYVVDATLSPGGDLSKGRVDLSGWRLSVSPRDEWRQMFDEAWRLERDYFYDRDMHGVDWPAMRARYQPLLDRVADRNEPRRPDRPDGERALGPAHLRLRRRSPPRRRPRDPAGQPWGSTGRPTKR